MWKHAYFRVLCSNIVDDSRDLPSPPRSPSLRPSARSDNATATPNYRSAAYDDYDTLIDMGGRPSTPINPDPGPWDPAKADDEEGWINRHWGSIEWGRARKELQRWKAFRRFQADNRKGVEKFKDYLKWVNEFRAKRKIQWTLSLQLQWDLQTKLDEWKEYHLFFSYLIHFIELGFEEYPERQLVTCSQYTATDDGYSTVTRRGHERLSEFLKWIEEQLPIIATECVASEQQGEINGGSTTPSEEELLDGERRRAYENYDTLIQMGGRPRAPINPDPGVCDDPSRSEVSFVLDHWRTEGGRIRKEMIRWKAFRRFQANRRSDSGRWYRWLKFCDRFRASKKVKWTVDLRQQSERQTKLDEWKEYCIFHGWGLHEVQNTFEKLEAQARLRGTQSLGKSILDHKLWSWNDDRGNIHKDDVPELRDFSNWMEGQLSIIGSEGPPSTPGRKSHGDPQNQTRPPSAEPSSNEAKSKPQSRASRRAIGRRNQQCKTHSALGPIHSTKVSKTSRVKPRALGQEKGAARKEMPSDPDGGQPEAESLAGIRVRRSIRIAKQSSNRATWPLGPVSSSRIRKIGKPSPRSRQQQRFSQGALSAGTNDQTRARPSVDATASERKGQVSRHPTLNSRRQLRMRASPKRQRTIEKTVHEVPSYSYSIGPVSSRLRSKGMLYA